MTVQQAFELALHHHQSGRLAEAEALYRQILAVQPRHADALHLLGVAAHQAGRNDLAAEWIRQAITLNPNAAAYHSNLGEACRMLGRPAEAVASFRRAITLRPDYPEAYNNLGIVLFHISSLDEAVASFRQAVALRPGYAEAHGNLGNALMHQGHLEDAITAFRQAVALKPGRSEAHASLGTVLREAGRLHESIAAFRDAIALQPGVAETHSDLGVSLQADGQLGEAVAAFRRGIALNPALPEIHSNLGNALRDAGDFDGAIAAIRQAVALRPGLAAAHANLGAALHAAGQTDESVASFRHALALDPGNAAFHSSLIAALNYHPDCDAAAIAAECLRWNERHEEPLRHFIRPHPNDPRPDRRLRIGYVSADYREHIVGHYLLHLFAGHDHTQYEILCYSAARRPDEFTARFRSMADAWADICAMTDAQAAERIRGDGVDILVDLSLHSAGNRLPVFARRPAPVQTSFAAYPGSTGLDAIGWRISDPHLEGGSPHGRACAIPSFWCYDGIGGKLPVNALPASENGAVTFGCLNNFCKTNPATLALWAKVMLAVPSSRLLLLAPPGSHRERTVNFLASCGIAPERIAFVSQQPRDKYMELYHRIDMSLDTLPYNGHTTSLDSLWMGVPVVTLVGRTIVGRAGLSQLMNLGLPDLIAHSPEQYVQIAAALAGDLPRLAHLRATLRERMAASPLMDAARFARDIEAAYRAMWRAWCADTAGKSPAAKGARP